MTVFEEHAETLEQHEFMMGTDRGRLAVSMDLLTDALILAGQHGVYMQTATKSQRIPRDVEMIIRGIEQAKDLVQSVMESLEAKRKSSSSATS
ncbi:MAG: hypothetical protein LC114_13530 [Bryobacterales bacterium]|nr:hypothetical protein [Bryobacterales bacterium]